MILLFFPSSSSFGAATRLPEVDGAKCERSVIALLSYLPRASPAVTPLSLAIVSIPVRVKGLTFTVEERGGGRGERDEGGLTSFDAQRLGGGQKGKCEPRRGCTCLK